MVLFIVADAGDGDNHDDDDVWQCFFHELVLSNPRLAVGDKYKYLQKKLNKVCYEHTS